MKIKQTKIEKRPKNSTIKPPYISVPRMKIHGGARPPPHAHKEGFGG